MIPPAGGDGPPPGNPAGPPEPLPPGPDLPGPVPPDPVLSGTAAGMPPVVPESAPPPKLRDAALILPLLGAFLLLPPLTDLFVAPMRIAGIPLIVLYLFGVWLGLILVALWLARRLRGPEPGGRPSWPGEEPGLHETPAGPQGGAAPGPPAVPRDGG